MALLISWIPFSSLEFSIHLITVTLLKHLKYNNDFETEVKCWGPIVPSVLKYIWFPFCKMHRCDPYDPLGFKAWAMKGECPAIPFMLGLFDRLVQSGFKVILLTGRDEETLGQATTDNLLSQGFIGYERIIFR